MDSLVKDIFFMAGCASFFLFLLLFLNLYKSRLLSHSLKLCSWICGMAIISDSPWVKMFVLHLVFSIRLLMYLAIISLEQVDKLTAWGILRRYASGTRFVLSEYIFAFLQSSEKFERFILSSNPRQIDTKDQDPGK
ncbi:hypothetical protein RG963_02270 [Methanosarcina sp. Z-7115]|uniref:Mobile element protein n=1 Tax=Methanosarcina baikalica TaxID=3073890 RepID=A0ABU2CY27_9EURY|nr:hypothetical protein [Methanosarcina sp. Z-7115]MDR7664629.1 hypothetical protein [Methanosarcina sp. Z-7115]